jgi:hypothetical protein
MSLQEFAGAISLEVDSREVEVTSFSVKASTGRKAVKTMNKAMQVKGFSRGIKTYDLSVTAVIPLTGSPIDWENIEGAKLTAQPVGGGKRQSYLDCFTVELGEKYEVDGEAVIDISMIALRKVLE